MKKGDKVRIYPHGDESKAAIATVELWAPNGRACALCFEEPPPFCRILSEQGGFALNRSNWQVTMLLGRQAVDGRCIGPWVELKGGGHYEIDEQAQACGAPS